MDFEIPAKLAGYLAELDRFIASDIRPLEQADDNVRFFDHRREDARTDWEKGGLPTLAWEALLAEARRRASIMISSSMMRSFAGAQVGWTT